MADLFKALKPEKHNAKSGFDLSQKHVFSMKAGQLVPCLALETIPDDYHEIDLMSLTRTMTLNTAAFLRGKMRYDFFFVPNSQLWHMFNQFITQRSDKHSTLSKGAKFCPNVSLGSILSMIANTGSGVTDIHGYQWRENAVRLLDMLGYGNHSYILDPDAADVESYISNYSGKYVNIFRLAAYQHIWYDFYRNKFYDTGDSGDASSVDVGDYVSYFNFDDIQCTTAATSHIPVSTTAEIARVRGLLGMRYVQWKKDLFTSALPGQQFGVVSSVDLGFSDIPISVTGSASLSGSTGDDNGKWSLYNSGGSAMPTDLDVRTSERQLYVSTQDASPVITHYHDISGSASLSGSASATGTTSFDVLSLYKAQMLQNWKQATLRAGNMTDDNFMAHYGVTPRYEGDENVDFLGSFDCPLQINAVEATATTAQTINGKVGELGATGTAVASGNKIKYKSRDFGIIMCVASFLPESEYSSNMLDKANTLLEEFDYYTPEFENIGLEAIPLSLFNASVPSDFANAVMGYAPRYYMYKTALDKVHGAFANAAWYKLSTQGVIKTDVLGSMSPWVAPRQENFVGRVISGAFSRKLSTFYVNPNVFDNVFGVNSDSSQDTDQFLNNVFFDIKSIRPMSVLGLPQF